MDEHSAWVSVCWYSFSFLRGVLGCRRVLPSKCRIHIRHLWRFKLSLVISSRRHFGYDECASNSRTAPAPCGSKVAPALNAGTCFHKFVDLLQVVWFGDEDRKWMRFFATAHSSPV